jgi:hypothetical protein
LFGFGPGYGRVTGTGAFWENACWAGRFLDDGRVEPGLFGGRPCGLSGCAASADPSVSFALCVLRLLSSESEEAVAVRSVALDVHLEFCEVALVEDGEFRCAGRIATTPEQLELFAGSLGPDDRVALG